MVLMRKQFLDCHLEDTHQTRRGNPAMPSIHSTGGGQCVGYGIDASHWIAASVLRGLSSRW